MGDNLVVDVSSINATISTVRRLMSEASRNKYYVMQWGGNASNQRGSYSSPLHMSSGSRDFRIEAVSLSTSQRNQWTGWGTSKTVSRKYNFVNDFTMMPVITATYDGPTDNVSVRIDADKDSVTVNVTHPTKKWYRATFLVHVIAMGY